jgi:alkanesulfonate monooxygenase SsuD/methylene tetrahydromethanopterin reductase-like flavin-dependent oxidoreductase (luciferase family)
MQWILSSSGGSSSIAAKFGMGLAVAKFINGFVRPDVVETYRKNFRPSDQYAKPHAMLSVFVLCGETEEKAAEMRKMMDYILVEFERGKFGPFPDAETVKKYRFPAASWNASGTTAGASFRVRRKM